MIQCPVCGRMFKNEHGLSVHISKQNDNIHIMLNHYKQIDNHEDYQTAYAENIDSMNKFKKRGIKFYDLKNDCKCHEKCDIIKMSDYRKHA